QRVINNKEIFSQEYRILNSWGELYWVHLRAKSMLDTTGNFNGYIGTIVDITERKIMEEFFREREERCQFALEGSSDGIWDWYIQTGEIFFSNGCKEMLGFSAQNAPLNLIDWMSLVHPDDLFKVTEALKRHFSGTEKIYAVEKRLRCQDGTYKWVL